MHDALKISGDIIAENISYTDFLAGFHGESVEWVNSLET
jgi:hypothetical protein